MAPPAPLGPGWRVTGGGVMARHWQDACVDAVAKLLLLRARRFSGSIRVELGAFLSIRSDDSSRLVDEAAHRRGRGVIAPPAPLGPGWRVTGAGVMATHWQDACVDAVAKLLPLRALPFLGNDPAWSFAPSSNPRCGDGSTHDRS